ncbi:MAG: hypothetical protein WBR56_06210, partial [Sedimenticolaceae bacterium]
RIHAPLLNEVIAQDLGFQLFINHRTSREARRRSRRITPTRGRPEEVLTQERIAGLATVVATQRIDGRGSQGLQTVRWFFIHRHYSRRPRRRRTLMRYF